MMLPIDFQDIPKLAPAPKQPKERTKSLNGPRCQVCNKMPRKLGRNCRENLVICWECDRRNNPYYYSDLQNED